MLSEISTMMKLLLQKNRHSLETIAKSYNGNNNEVLAWAVRQYSKFESTQIADFQSQFLVSRIVCFVVLVGKENG
jgi:hypothetical protein